MWASFVIGIIRAVDPTISVSRRFAHDRRPRADGDAVTALVVLWSRDEPERVGEVVPLPGGFPGAEVLIGRAPPADDGVPRLGWLRQRPGQSEPTGPLRSPTISREQLRFTADEHGALTVENVGRGDLLHQGRKVARARLAHGDLLELRDRLLMMCARRPPVLPLDAAAEMPPAHPFGEADAQGIVGESPAAWALRQRIAFVARRHPHVLIHGESGSGKELVAGAIHRLSDRGRRPLISRNAATIPDSLADAELFGNARNYPNPGTPERPGLIGAADGSTLFLDEFAELPEALQARLLRVLDAGEYHRLGETTARRADFRLVAATNRPDDYLKHDVRARLKLRVDVPGLDARREDVPLIARHLLRRILEQDAPLRARLCGEDGLPRMTPALVAALVRHDYTTHVRELEALLWQALAQTPGEVLDVWADFPAGERATSAPERPANAPAAEAVDPATLTPEEIQACLDRHDGRQEPAWRELGLSSRHVLTRLVRKYGLRVRGRTGG